MTDREALIAAIAASPADDLPRLVFADWLDDNGDPAQAEFIRAHVRLYRTRTGTGEHFAIAKRCDELMRANCGAWLKEASEGFGVPVPLFAAKSPLSWFTRDRSLHLRSVRYSETAVHARHAQYVIEFTHGNHCGPSSKYIQIHRGFICKARIGVGRDSLVPVPDASQFASTFRNCPILALEIDVADGTDRWDSVTGCHVNRLRAMTVVHDRYFRRLVEPNEALYSRLFQDPHLARLNYLGLQPGMELESFGYCHLSMSALTKSPLIHQLKVLRLKLCARVLEALADYPASTPLEEIAAHESGGQTPDTWAVLATIPLRQSLRRLSLKSCLLHDEEVLAITRVRRWDKLTHLRLDQNQIADRGVAGMCRTCVFPEVRFLNLADNQIGDLGAVAIARSGIAQTVRFLDLTKNCLTATGAIPLAAALAEGPLELLKLTARPLGRRTVRRVSEMLGRRVRFE